MNRPITIEQVQLLTTERVAELLNVAPATLVDWRHDQRGPKYYKMGRQIRYRLEDILKWQNQNLEPIEPTEL